VSGNLQSEIGTRLPPEAATRILVEHLRKYAKGLAAATPKWQIRGDLAAAGLHLSSRDFDALAQEAVLSCLPVGSCDRGFYYMDSREDFRAARAYLVCRFGPIKERIEAVERMERDRFCDPALFEP